MRFQPDPGTVTNDVVQTPPKMAQRLVEHFRPTGVILEPCRGEGNIYRAMPKGSIWCEISEGIDFLQFQGRVDWIVTNPPWSLIREFLIKGMEVADNIVFLMTVNHAWTRARVREVLAHGFSLKEIVLLPTPEGAWPSSGFQLGAVHWQRGWLGPITQTDLNHEIELGASDLPRPRRAKKPKRPQQPLFEGLLLS